ncbi:hypothetical protein A1OE_975 [Candidatus Endolissoclinum faulkneri L2]|uniref:Uncharacterized protein n=1 Tax=Candidatus Endolissoclinum faulkneri L2 TaxID=1193729 RepID=K7ZD38_9PROT|nr:hypothetical protein A1OE_975 [Candidatus Endolissoclinum faulkneri L2]
MFLLIALAMIHLIIIILQECFSRLANLLYYSNRISKIYNN